MRVAITGSTGFIGSALATRLESQGNEIVRISRRPGPGTVTWDLDAFTLAPGALENCGAVVHLAGESIQGRWTAAKKQRLMDSRVRSTELLAQTIKDMDAPPAVFVCGSAVGYYGSRGADVLTESEPAGSTFLAEVTEAWEQAASPIAEAGSRLTFARTSIVLGDGGALPRMKLLTKLLAGGPLGSGRQYWSWITLEDELRAIEHLMESDIEGPVNLGSPHPVPQREFARSLGRALGRPTVMPAPGFAIKAVLGEMGQALLLDSARMAPAALEASGFVFEHPDLETALAAVL